MICDQEICDQEEAILYIANCVQDGLAQAGLCHTVNDDQMFVAVPFNDLQWTTQGDGEAPDFALLEVDMRHLPRNVTAPKLTRPGVLKHLTAFVGRPVYPLNTSGVTYCVDLRPPRARGAGAAARLPERVDYDGACQPESATPKHLALGASRKGPLWVHPEQLKNVLVVGAQGYGKSALLRLLVYQALRSGWRLLLADPEGVTFNPLLWRGVEALIGGNVASSPSEVELLFNLAFEEIERRAKLYTQVPGYPDSLKEYNAIAADPTLSDSVQPLPRWGLFVDEANTYLSDKRLAEGAADLARRGRKWGLHCIFAGHDWRANEIPRGMSGMLQTRVAFRTNDDTSGKVVLGRPGAEGLPAIPGRAIVKLDGYHLVQAYFLDKAWLVKLVERQHRVASPPSWEELAERTADSDDEADLLAQQAQAMYAEGMSKRQIALQLYGGDGGAAWRKMEEALQDSTTTTEQGSGE